MGKEHKEEKSFWKWTFKKWYFWLIVIAHFFLKSLGDLRKYEELYMMDVVMSFAVAVAVWSFIFWVFYLICVGGCWNKKDPKN